LVIWPKVGLEVMEHHAGVGKVSPEVGNERAAGAPALEWKWRAENSGPNTSEDKIVSFTTMLGAHYSRCGLSDG
jgi:hypothetical protein